jgi:glycosyltransferase involved in cell wall biosynthesis
MKVCQAFSELGHQVKLWVPGIEPNLDWEGLASQYGIRSEFPIRWLKSKRYLRRHDFAIQAILQAHNWKADLFYTWPLQAAALASILRLPALLEMHDQPRGRFGPHYFRWYLKGRGASRLLLITDSLRKWLASAYKVKLEEPFASVAPMGVDLFRFENLPTPLEARRQLGISEGFTAGYTGHLYSGRGLDLLFQLALQNEDVQFLWIGGEEKAIQHWRSFVASENVKNIHVVGFVENEHLPLYQAACEVLLMPYERRISISSGGDTAPFASPMKVFEYLATGRTILSSDLPVLKEVLNESNAVLIPPEDLAVWDRSLREIVKDPERRMLLEEQCKRDASKYQWIERAKRSIEDLPSRTR